MIWACGNSIQVYFQAVYNFSLLISYGNNKEFLSYLIIVEYEVEFFLRDPLHNPR